MTRSESDLFGIHNIPFGIASSTLHPQPQCATRYGDSVLMLGELAKGGLFDHIDADFRGIFSLKTLNAFAATPKALQRQIREKLQTCLESGGVESLPQNSVVPVADVEMHLPVSVGDYTDYCSSKEHNLLAGEAILGTRKLPPGFLHFPIGYHGRASTIVISGTPVERPVGQFPDRKAEGAPVVCRPSAALDYELEMGAIIGKPVVTGQRVHAAEADEHIFGLVLINDWSSRDIQGFEMNPLGPFNGKNFATSCSPWIITLDALEPYKTPAPARDVPVAKYLDDPQSTNYSIELQSEIIFDGKSTVTCRTGFQSMYWTFRQMLAHHTIGGCNLNTGDIIASGTISYYGDLEHGCLLETTAGGKKPFTLASGATRSYLLDGDVVRLSGVAYKEGAPPLGFGDCIGQIKPSSPLRW